MEKKDKMKLVSFTLSESTVKKVDLLVTKGVFVTRNEAIRAALEMYFNGTAKRWLEMYRRRKAKRS